MGRPQTYWRLLRYEWSDPSLMGSLMMMSPLRILILYKQEGFVQTHALYSMEAPWLPKSESGTRSPSLHLRQRGKAFSTKSPPSFLIHWRIVFVCSAHNTSKTGRRSKPRGSLRLCIRIPTAGIIHAAAIIPQIMLCVSTLLNISSSFFVLSAPSWFSLMLDRLSKGGTAI